MKRLGNFPTFEEFKATNPTTEQWLGALVPVPPVIYVPKGTAVVDDGQGGLVIEYTPHKQPLEEQKTMPHHRPEISNVALSGEKLSIVFADGRELTVPLKWYPRLARASTEQRNNWRLVGGGSGVHWPDIDEDLSAEGLLAGAPSPE